MENYKGRVEKNIRVRNVSSHVNDELLNISKWVGKSVGEVIKDKLPLIVKEFPAHYSTSRPKD